MKNKLSRKKDPREIELENCGWMPIFEIEVRDKEGDQEYVNCDISFTGRSIMAQRDGVSTGELRSNLIATTKVALETHWSLDEALQELHSAILSDICNGNLYTLPE